MTFHWSSPVTDTLAGRSSPSRATSEQVASKLTPATAAESILASPQAVRTAAQTARQMSSLECSAWSGAGRSRRIGWLARARL
jgi:hypothetical protein